MISRREFFRAAGAMTALAATTDLAACARHAAVVSGSTAAGGAGGALLPISAVGLQLYTVRNLMQQDANAALTAVADAGYRLVETAGLAGRSAADFRALLDQHGISTNSGHWQLSDLERDPDAMIATAHTLGQKYVVVAYLPEEARRSLDDWRSLADRFNRVGQRLQGAGLQLGYHNHTFEFATYGGTTPGYDLFVQGTDPKLVSLEVDLFWMTAAGANPVSYFERFPGRFQLCHLKDMRAGSEAAEQRMTSVGSGTIDWKGIIAAGVRNGLRYGYVEHDNPTDAIVSIRESHQYLARILA